MRGQEFRARDKKIQKMTRDGLTEKNLTSGTEQRISSRLADASFGREKAEDTAAGHRAENSKQKNMRGTDAPVCCTRKVPEDRKRSKAVQHSLMREKITGEILYGEVATPRDEKSATEKRTVTPHPKRQYEKAQGCMEKEKTKPEKVRERPTTNKHIRQQKSCDTESGKVRNRLCFEKEMIPEKEKLLLSNRAGRAAGYAVSTAAVLKAHRKISEAESDNVGVEASHKAEFTVERGAGWAVRKKRQRLQERSCREGRRAEKRHTQKNADTAYRKLFADNPEPEKKVFAKWIQKQKLKRKYAAAVREAEKEIKHTTNMLNAAGQVVRAMAQALASHKTVLGIVGIGVLIAAMCSSLISACSAMLSGVQSAVISTCYVAEDAEINQSELRYTELETDLQMGIDQTEEDYPGYDEYRYNIGEIGHSPYELMGYLSAAYNDFTYAQVETEINRLFGEQYQFTREEITETRTYTDDEGEEHEYEWYVLKTTLSVRPLGDVIAGSLTPGDVSDRYGIYMQTCGNRQCYGNPFDFDWISNVTSPYGYRIHPVSGEKNLHRGVDIGIAEGTPVKAAQDGIVVSAGNAGDYGLCVVIEGEGAYQSRYAHCSSILVGTGQKVKRGDVIAAVGSTGNSTGPHLHLEVTHNGEYLNPYYYVAGGGAGYLPGGGVTGGPDFTEDPGEAMGDGSFSAMLEEAEKYLGFPYVWGGSSPSTSFDCSGFVSWVINHSGVGSVGRQTAQGLYNLCIPVPKENIQPGDLIFFTGTSSSANPVTHVGIYIGNGKMLHCGDPISYADINSQYWSGHFYSGGRLP